MVSPVCLAVGWVVRLKQGQDEWAVRAEQLKGAVRCRSNVADEGQCAGRVESSEEREGAQLKEFT